MIVFSQEEVSDSGGNSWCDLWDDPCGESDCASGTGASMLVVPVLPDMTDVPVSPSSVVTEVCDGFLLGSDWEICGTASPFLSP